MVLYLIYDKIILSFIVVLIFTILLSIHSSLKKKFRKFVEEMLKSLNGKEVLIVIAHPDDETIFFFPTMKSLISKGVKVNILCLSNGDYDGLGNIREKEMQALKQHLSLNSVEVINNDKLKDDITKFWDTQIVANEILQYIVRNTNKQIGAIFTFDQRGVSKHPNHISCYNGIM